MLSPEPDRLTTNSTAYNKTPSRLGSRKCLVPYNHRLVPFEGDRQRYPDGSR